MAAVTAGSGPRGTLPSPLVSMASRVLGSAAVRLLTIVFAATAFVTGALASSVAGGSANAAGTQAWTLDPLGNWADASTWTSGSTPTPEDRTHNKVNEVLTRDLPGTSADHALGFDNAGNLATVAVAGGSTTTYTHDLWNRLVKVTVPEVMRLAILLVDRATCTDMETHHA